jgi:hypothetical protein
MDTSNITMLSVWFASTPSMSFALTALAHFPASARIWVLFEVGAIRVPPWVPICHGRRLAEIDMSACSSCWIVERLGPRSTAPQLWPSVVRNTVGPVVTRSWSGSNGAHPQSCARSVLPDPHRGERMGGGDERALALGAPLRVDDRSRS